MNTELNVEKSRADYDRDRATNVQQPSILLAEIATCNAE
jgi:hypothetical protein